MQEEHFTTCNGIGCKLCGKYQHGYGHNGQPLVNGRVCDECNNKVIEERIKRIGLEDSIEAEYNMEVSENGNSIKRTK